MESEGVMGDITVCVGGIERISFVLTTGCDSEAGGDGWEYLFCLSLCVQ
jgi:hypothetical protein